MNSEKISKSRGGAPNLDDVRERGIAPLAYRLLLLGARYRQRIDLSWQSLAAAQRALTRIGQALQGAPREPPDADEPRWVAFRAALADDLDTPRALAILHESRRDARLLRAMTDALGLGAAVHALDEQGEMSSMLLVVVGIVETGSDDIDATIAHVALADVFDLISSGAITDAKSVAGLTMAYHRLLR